MQTPVGQQRAKERLNLTITPFICHSFSGAEAGIDDSSA